MASTKNPAQMHIKNLPDKTNKFPMIYNVIPSARAYPELAIDLSRGFPERLPNGSKE